ncbi:MAG TPA: ester cyclase [Anaeromyxobacteraceae bacterium]|nr:ester cyclase [Anaeromyxobacteraceae bacterium]
MAVDLKQSVRRLIEEAYGKGNYDVFDEVCDPGYRAHDPLSGDTDLAKSKALCQGYKEAFPDLKPTILASFIDGDCVITQWRMTGTHQRELMGIAPTGNRCTVEGISISRFRGAKIVEDWVQWDALGFMKQLGVAPNLQAGAGGRTQPRPHA